MSGIDELCPGCRSQPHPGIITNAVPDCCPSIPNGYVFVERCDECQRYDSDMEAALVIFYQVQEISCINGGRHIIAKDPKSRRPWETVESLRRSLCLCMAHIRDLMQGCSIRDLCEPPEQTLQGAINALHIPGDPMNLSKFFGEPFVREYGLHNPGEDENV